jgi:crossover junction endodeoxyribonuclease RuvC
MALKVMGIDPGLHETGVGIVTGGPRGVTGYAFGVIGTRPCDAQEIRLAAIYSETFSFLEEERPDLVVVEAAFSLSQYPKSGILLGKAMGALLAACGQRRVPVLEIPVREAKKVLTGNGRATKAQLELAVRSALGRDAPISPKHSSDALALALIGLSRGFPALTGGHARLPDGPAWRNE